MYHITKKTAASGKWHANYDYESYILAEEFNDKNQDASFIKDMTTSSLTSMEFKNGSALTHVEKYIITTNQDPNEWWNWENPESKAAAQRRLIKIKCVKPANLTGLDCMKEDIISTKLGIYEAIYEAGKRDVRSRRNLQTT